MKVSKVELSSLVAGLAGTGGRVRGVEAVTCPGTLDLAKLGSHCPNLSSLETYYSGRLAALSRPSLAQLTRIVVYATEISADAANAVLEHCPLLTHATLTSANTFDRVRLGTTFTSAAAHQSDCVLYTVQRRR